MVEKKISNYYTLMKNDDYIVRDHRVHKVRIMPGVTFLDIVYKAFEAEGYNISSVELNNILFKEPVATSELYDKKIKIEIIDCGESGFINGKSIKIKDEEVIEESWADNFECEFSICNQFVDEEIDIEQIKNSSFKVEDMDSAYSWARKVNINHYEFMKVLGKTYFSTNYILGELHLSQLAASYSPYAYLHPAFMDSSTIIPMEIHLENESKIINNILKPYIPFYIKSFKAKSKVNDRCYILIKDYKSFKKEESDDLKKTNIYIYSNRGTLLAFMEGLTYKKVRDEKLITKLIDVNEDSHMEIDKSHLHKAQDIKTVKVNKMKSLTNTKNNTEQLKELIRNDIKQMVANVLDCNINDVKVDVGYYDQGLDSSNLLLLVQMIEKRLGEKLYPTLLFEYTTVNELVNYLNDEYVAVYKKAFINEEQDDEVIEEMIEKEKVHLFTSEFQEKELNNIMLDFNDIPTVLVLDNDNSIINKIKKINNKAQIISVRTGSKFNEIDELSYEINLEKENDYSKLFTKLIDEDKLPSIIIDNLAYEDNILLFNKETKNIGVNSIFHLSKTLMKMKIKNNIKLVFLHYKYFHKDLNLNIFNPIYEGLVGFFKTIYLENPKFKYILVGMDERDVSIKALLQECILNNEDYEVKYLDGKRFVKKNIRLNESYNKNPIEIKEKGVYLLTGGLGGLGLIFTTYLSQYKNITLVLVGRRDLDSTNKKLINELEKKGSKIKYIKADIAKANDLNIVYKTIVDEFGKLNGILHMAGVNNDDYILNKKFQDIEKVTAAKVEALINLDNITMDEKLDFFMVFSSTTSVMGNDGQCDYAYANYFMNNYVIYRNMLVKDNLRFGKSIAICWPLWADGGMQVDKIKEESILNSIGMIPLKTENGLKVFEHSLETTVDELIAIEGIENKLLSALDIQEDILEEVDFGNEELKEVEKVKNNDEIAIIGMSGVYPKAENLGELWENLTQGMDCITEIPNDRWSLEENYEENKDVIGKSYSKYGGFIDNIECFDALFFNISPKEAEIMDPQERLFLQEVYHAFEDAGYSKSNINGTKTGVFVGAMWGQYEMIHGEIDGNKVAPASIHSAIANRVSYYFNFRGPSLAVDTMCSSSLTSIHLACKSLRDGECELAVAGGVNTSVHPNKYIYLSDNRFLSSEGKCKAFADGGDGYVPGEGVGALVLKSLKKAIADGDNIYGVIKGSSINHGGKASGYTVPNPVAQAEVIKDTLIKSNIDPRSISYIEAHGTGTSLGDPIEILGLTKAFKQFTDANQFCSIGSIKSNIGHLESAAGVAAVSKVLLQFKHKTLLPSIHLETKNKNIDFSKTPFYLQEKLSKWRNSILEINGEKKKIPLRAGVSAFGAGGSNAHIILEEYIDLSEKTVKQSFGKEIIILSAANGKALKEQAKNVLKYLQKDIYEEDNDNSLLLEEISKYIKEMISKYILMDVEDIEDNIDFIELGIDVIDLNSIVNEIISKYSVDININEIVTLGNINKIAEFIYSSIDLGKDKIFKSSNINKERSLKEIAFTLQIGREEMEERIAIVVDSLEDLTEELIKFCKNDISRKIYQGRKSENNRLSNILNNKLTNKFMDDLINNNEYETICELWVQGIIINWKSLYKGNKINKISLPGYPFEKKRYWIDVKNQKASISIENIHPLLDQNISNFYEQIYQKGFTGNELYFKEHQLEKIKVLPGTFYIEMALAAANLAIPNKKINTIENIAWNKLLTEKLLPDNINVQIYNKDNKFEYIIRSNKDNGENYFSRGDIVLNHLENTNKFSIVRLHEKLKNLANNKEIYNRFLQIGFDYGNNFRNIEYIKYSKEEAIAKIILPNRIYEEINKYYCNPIILDSALQVSSFLFEFDLEYRYIPIGLEKITINNQLTKEVYAYVELKDSDSIGEGILEFDILLLDLDGNILVKIDSFKIIKTIKSVEKTNKSIASVEYKNDIETFEDIKEDYLIDNTRNYIRTLIKKYFRINEDEIDNNVSFEKYGINSIIIMKMNKELESDFTKISKTIFFENDSINELTDYLIKNNKNDLIKLFSDDQKVIQIKENKPNIMKLDHGVHYFKDIFISKNYEKLEYSSSTLIVFDYDDELSTEVQNRGVEEVILVKMGDKYLKNSNKEYIINPLSSDDVINLFKQFDLDKIDYHNILINLANKELEFNENNISSQIDNSIRSLFILTKALSKQEINLIYLSRVESIGQQPIYAAINGFIRSARVENPKLNYKYVEMIGLNAKMESEFILNEYNKDLMGDIEVRIDELGRYVKSIEEITKFNNINSLSFRQEGVYIITGGMGGVGYIIAKYLAKEYNAKLLLTGRRKEDNEIEQKINELNELGAEAIYIAGDICSKEQVKSIVKLSKNKFNKIHGLVHCAGIIKDSFIIKKNIESLNAVLEPKVNGTINLYNELKDENLEAFILFGSVAGLLGNIGQCDYAFANSFMSNFAKAKSKENRVICISWPLWETGGMQIDEDVKEYLNDMYGMSTLLEENAIEALIKSLQLNEDNLIVMEGNGEKFEKSLDSNKTVKIGIDSRSSLPLKNEVHKLQQVANLNSNNSNKDKNKDLAVIGISGKYPMADNIDELWVNLQNSKDCITEIPKERWEYIKYYNEDKNSIGTSYSKWGGFISDIDKFDPLIFNISPREAELMAPEEKLFLETAYHTFEDAGYSREKLSGKNIGVFVGSMYNQYQLMSGVINGTEINPMTFNAGLSNRVSYFFNLHGPSLTVDTMCSSAFTSLHLACESVKSGESEMALVGGVNLSLHPNKYNILSMNKFLSADGKCRSFGDGGDGYVPGEGVGAVLIKPLDKAINDNDNIYGIIKATSINHDGKTNGYTVPNPKAQHKLIDETIEKAGIKAEDISYIEAHGTGTALGDPIEITGLKNAFEKYTNKKQFCAIGSIKSNIGHLEAASGIASLTKVLLQMKYKKLVPSIHSERINENIDFLDTPFYVQHEIADWKRNAMNIPRIAGISAYGAGGTNVHVIVQEYLKPILEDEQIEDNIVVLSAKDKTSLKEYASQLKNYINKNINNKELNINDLAYTLQNGRTEMEERLAIICSSNMKLSQLLERYLNNDINNKNIFVGRVNRKKVNSSGSYTLLTDITEAWVKGEVINWKNYYSKPRNKISLPCYPFKKKRYWIGSYNQIENEGEKPLQDVYSNLSSEIINFNSDKVNLEIMDDSIAILTLNDRENKNVFSKELRQGLIKRLWEINHNDKVKVVIVTGYENIFCMGATEGQLNDISNNESSFTDEPILFKGLLECKVPVISAIQGHASGGGLLFGLYGDIVILGEESIYSAVFMKYGFTPGMGATLILEDKLGKNIATEMMYTAKYYTGEELRQRGATVNIVKQEYVLDEAIKIAKTISSKPRVSLVVLKKELAGRILSKLDDIIQKEDEMHKQTFSSKEVRENINHFYLDSKKFSEKLKSNTNDKDNDYADEELKVLAAELESLVEEELSLDVGASIEEDDGLMQLMCSIESGELSIDEAMYIKSELENL